MQSVQRFLLISMRCFVTITTLCQRSKLVSDSSWGCIVTFTQSQHGSMDKGVVIKR